MVAFRNQAWGSGSLVEYYDLESPNYQDVTGSSKHPSKKILPRLGKILQDVLDVARFAVTCVQAWEKALPSNQILLK